VNEEAWTYWQLLGQKQKKKKKRVRLSLNSEEAEVRMKMRGGEKYQNELWTQKGNLLLASWIGRRHSTV